MRVCKRLLSLKPVRLARGLFAYKRKLFVPILFAITLALLGMGMFSMSPSHARADTNVNMSQDQFNAGYQNVKNNKGATGNWGTAPWYISNNQMYVGSGKLLGGIFSQVGFIAPNLQAVNFTASVQAPQDSSYLLSNSVASLGVSAPDNTSLTSINGLTNMDTSQVTNMSNMFSYNSALKNFDISNWNTSNVKNMGMLFALFPSLNSLDISKWDTTNTSNMNYIFSGDNNLNNLILSDKTPLKDVKYLPGNEWSNGTQTLTSDQLKDGTPHPGNWHITQFSYNLDNAKKQGWTTGKWGTANYYIDNQNNMYVGAGNLQGGLYNAIGSSNAGHIQTLNFTGPVQAPQDSSFLLSTSSNWVSSSTVLNQINGLDKLDMSQATNLNGIFFSDMGLTNLDLSSWNIDNAKYAAFAFWNDVALRYLNLSSWNTSNMSSMNDTFDVTVNLYHLVLGDRTYIRSNKFSGFSGSKNTNVSFSNGQQFLNSKQLEDGNSHPGDWQKSQFSQNFLNAQQNHWQTGNWGTAPYYIDPNNNMHVGAGELQSNLANNVGNSMASSLNTVNFDEPVTAPQDSSFLLSTSNLGVVNNSNLATINGLSNIDTSQATNMDNLFSSDTKLNNLDLSSWNTSNVKSMGFAFYNNFGLTNLNVSDWDTSHVNNMFSTFSGDLQLPNLDVTHWDTSNVSNMSYTFYNNWALHDINLLNWSSNDVQTMKSMFLYDGINNLTLGSQMKLKNEANLLQNSWQSNGSFLNSNELEDGNSHPGDWQKDQFSNDFNAKQSQGQVTQSGYWGDAQYYIDNQNNMYVGAGHLNGTLYNVIGSDSASQVRALNFTDPVQAPQDSTFLLSTSTDWTSRLTHLSQINGLDKLDTSQTTNINGIFFNDAALHNLDLSHWNTSNVQSAIFAFWNDEGLDYLNLSNWDTSNVSSMKDAFDVTNDLYHLVLGDKTYIHDGSASGFDGRKNPNISLSNGQHVLTAQQLEDGNSHPGDWQKSQFSQDFLNAQQNHWQTGNWGTAPYYINPGDNSMHIGTGHLLSNLVNNIGNGAASSISSINFDEPVTAPQDSSFLLSTSNLGIVNNSNLATINGLSNIDTSQATNMDNLFSSDTKLNNLDLSSWNTSNVKSMGFAFYNNFGLTNLNVSDWDTSHVNNMFSTFSGDLQLPNLDVTHWDTSNVSNMSYAFYNDWALSNINLSNWSSENVQTMSGMFQYDNITDITLGERMRLRNEANLLQNAWQNGSQVLNSNELEDDNSHPGNWQENGFSKEFHDKQRQGQVIQSGYWGSAQYYIDNQYNMYVSSGKLDQRLRNIIGNDLTNRIQSLNFEGQVTAPQDSSFLLSTSNTGIMGVTNLKAINGLDKIDTSNVTSMNNIFSNDTNLTKLDLSSWNVDNVKDFSFAFWNNTNVSDMDLSTWDTSNATNMNDMFDVTNDLYHLILGDRTYIKGDILAGFSNSKHIGASFENENNKHISARQLEKGNSYPGNWHEDQFSQSMLNAQKQNWQTGNWGTAPYYIDPNNNMHVGAGDLQSNLANNVGNSMAGALNTVNFDESVKAPQDSSFLLSTSNLDVVNSSNLTTINGLNNIDTSAVTNMEDIFSSDTKLNNLDLSSWDVSNVKNLGFAFYNNWALTNLNVSDWNTNNLNNLFSIFSGTGQLTNLDVSRWNTSNVSNMSYAFYNDWALSNINLSNWSSENVQTMLGMFQYDNITDIILGERMKLRSEANLLQNTWQNGSQVLNSNGLEDGNNHPGHWQESGFSKEFHDKQKQGQVIQSGYWGSAQYYIDSNNNMYVGTGTLSGHLRDVIGNHLADWLSSLSFEDPVQAPSDSSFLLSTSNLGIMGETHLQSINGLNQIDMSQATSMNNIFSNDTNLTNLDLSSWNVNNMKDFSFAFWNNNSLSNLNLSNWNTSNASRTNDMFDVTNNLTNLTLGDKTRLLNGSNLQAGLWQNGTTKLTEKQMNDGQSHAGTWNHISLQNGGDLSGTTDDNLSDIIKRHLGLADDTNMQIINDQGSQRDGGMTAGDYDSVIYAVQNGSGANYYTSHLSIHAYTAGDNLNASQGQSLSDILNQHYTTNVQLDNDGNSTTDGKLNMGNYTIKYHYQDGSGNWNYRTSSLNVDNTVHVSLPYLLVTNDPSGKTNTDEIRQNLVQFFGLDNNASLDLAPSSNGTHAYDYDIRDGFHHYQGSLDTTGTASYALRTNDIPVQSDITGWNSLVMKEFSTLGGANIGSQDMTSYDHDDDSGQTNVAGKLYPSANQFVNNPSIPYSLQTAPQNFDFSVDNNINDQQVDDVLNAIDSNARITSVTDNQGNDMTPSLHDLSTIKDPTNITIRMRTYHGYVTLHLASVSDLVEPSVDIQAGDLASQIQTQTHESDFRNFGVDNTKDISPTVQQVDYHFTKNVQAKGNNVQVGTKDVTVTGTAYVHSDNTNPATPTFTIIQGANPIKHMENITGHTINMLQLPAGQDINNLPVGNYHVAYQYTDDDVGGTNNAMITVIPNYYFSSVTNDSTFDNQDPNKQVFAPNDYQHNGNYYKSVVDTSDHSHNDQNDHNNNNSNNNGQDYVDGLHTQDGKVAHFNSKNPYLK